MPLSLQLPCKKKVLSYDPQLYSKRLGYKCETCNVNLTHEKCISLCRCYLFCHQRCFISQFEHLLYDNDVTVKCKVCKETVGIKAETNYIYQPQKNFPLILKFIIAALFLIFCVIAIVVTVKYPLPNNLLFIFLYLEGLCLGIAIYLVVLSVRDLLYRKIVTISEIVPTRLQIQTSAFKDIDIETNQELTKDYLVFESKKEKC